jgi:hypothetical protein
MLRPTEEIKQGRNLVVSLNSSSRIPEPNNRETNFSPLSKIVLSHRDKFSPALRKVIGRRLDRYMFHKLKRLIYSLSVNISLSLIKQISRRLYDMVQIRTHKILVRFRMVGTVWPPVIVYRTKIINIHTLQLPGNELQTKSSEWRFLFTDQLYLTHDKLPSISPAHVRFQHPVLPFCKGGIRGRQKYFNRIEDSTTMESLLVKPRRKNRQVTVSQNDLSFRSPIKQVDGQYKKLWMSLGIVLLQWSSLCFSNVI